MTGADLARTIGKATAEDSDEAAAAKFMDAVEDLVKDLETPTLEEYGVDRKEFFDVIEKMAHDAMESGSPQNTRRPITEEEVEQLYRNLWD